jgi:hypothetical protein
MPIPIICPCSAKLRVNDRLKGQYIQCPKCGSVHPVGNVNGSTVAPPRPASTAQALSQSGLSDGERALLEQQLEDGERVVWAGKAAERIAFLRGLVATVGLGGFALVLLIVLVILLAQGVLSGTAGVVGGGFVGLLIVGCLAAGGAWPFWERHRARRTFYAITTRRALGWFCNLLGRVKLQVFEPAAVAGVQRMAFGKGSDAPGHLIFGARIVTRRIGDATHQYVERWGFFNVPRAAEVERVLRETLIDPFLEQTYDQKPSG